MRSRSSRTVVLEACRSPWGAGLRSGSKSRSIASIASTSAAPRLASLGSLSRSVVARLLRQHQGAALDEVGLDQRALRHLAGRLVGLDLPRGRVVAVGGVAQEDDAQHRHAVFAARSAWSWRGVVGRFPEVGFKLCKGCQLVLVHRWSALPVCLDLDDDCDNDRESSYAKHHHALQSYHRIQMYAKQ